MEEMLEQAHERGAAAIVGVDLDCEAGAPKRRRERCSREVVLSSSHAAKRPKSKSLPGAAANSDLV
jgi:hypothetical protein